MRSIRTNGEIYQSAKSGVISSAEKLPILSDVIWH